MKLLITGAAGFLGSEVAREALRRGHETYAMVRNGSLPPDLAAIRVIRADLAEFVDPAASLVLPPGIEAVVHCAAATSEGRPNMARSTRINVEGTAALARRVVETSGRPAAELRWIQISSMSAHPGSTSVYGRTKLLADDAVKTAGVAWTILRPSIIYGPGARGVVAKTVAIMRKLPVVPVVGAGRELLRPILASDVARLALNALDRPVSVGRTYMLGGPDEITFNDFLARLGEACGVRRPVVHLPIPIAHAIAAVLGAALPNPPLTTDNVLGVKQAQRVLIDDALRDLGPAGATFAEGLRQCAEG